MQMPSWCTTHQDGGHSSRTRTKVDLSICLTLCYFKCLLVSLLKVSQFAIPVGGREARHLQSSWNVIYERYKFNNRSQEPHESVDAYATALHALAVTCEFGVLKEEMVRDHIVCGIRDNPTCRNLLQEPKLSLKKCLDLCRASKAMTEQLKGICRWAVMPSPDVAPSYEEVCTIRTERKPKQFQTNFSPKEYGRNCTHCGRRHAKQKEMPSIWKNMQCMQKAEPPCGCVQSRRRRVCAWVPVLF